MSVVNFVNSRAIGLRHISRRTVFNWALAKYLKKRWKSASRLILLKDAAELLGRKICLWEARVLVHLLAIDSKNRNDLQEIGINSKNFSVKKDLQEHHVNFTDILEMIYFIGADVNRLDPHGTNVLMCIFETNGVQSDIEEAVRFLVGHGLDINRLGNAVLLEFSERLHKLGILGFEFLLKVCNILVGAGMILNPSANHAFLK